MKVILKQDVKKVGKKGQIVEVSDGYARNFLIARGLAVAETKKSLEILGEEKKIEAAEEKKREEAAKATAETLEGMTLDFHVRSGVEGKVFGSVSTKQIAQELMKKGITIDKKKILDTAPIQSLGVTKVRVELHKNVIGTIKVRLIGSEQ
ncbi:MAG: 50S ribosomal protein L9 [Erysipelotrichaceae bacterium]|jgi:large subunit ribosomal protein L9|nr:50S ribosomal protein L9 [Erysipelotrichaceae bacterium]